MSDTRAAARITAGLFLAHALGSAGAIAVFTVAAIAGAELSGRTALSGLPAAAMQVGGALAAVLVGWLTERLGRRDGLALSATIGALGMIATAVAASTGAFPWILIGLLVAGTANASVKFARFTAAEVQPRARRGRAVAIVVMGGTVGSVVGPGLVAPTGAWSAALGWGELTGPFVAALAAFVGAALCFSIFLRPEPRDLAVRLEAAGGDARDLAPARPLGTLLRDPGVVTAVLTLVLAQASMVMVMGITSLHMRVNEHALAAISVVVSGHTLGMFAFSLVSGWAADRFGRLPVLAVGGVTMIASCMIAPLSPTFLPLFVALFLLGYGWNLCYVAGSALLSDHLSTAERSATQGITDLAIGVVSGLSSLAGGVVFAIYGYAVMNGASIVAALVLLLLVARHRRRVAASIG